MKRKKIMFLTSIMLVILMSRLSLATETRVGSMGGVGFYTRDNSNIFYFPGTLIKYSNQVVAELRANGNDDLYTVGLQLSGNSERIFGIYLNRPIPRESHVASMIASVTPALKLRRCTSLFYGGSSPSVNYGLMVSIAMDKYSDNDDPDNEEKQNARYIGIAAGLSGDAYDIGFLFDLPNAIWEYSKAEDKWNGFGLGINARSFTQKSDEMELILLGTFYMASTKNIYDQGIEGVPDYENEMSLMDLGVGLGINYQVSRKNLVVLAVEAFGLKKESYKIKKGDEGSKTWTTLPGIYLGMESRITSWLISRLGATQIYQSCTEKEKEVGSDEEESTSYNSSFGVSFGLGIIAGSFELDAMFNESALFDGPNFISGRENALASRLSLTYHFNKNQEAKQ